MRIFPENGSHRRIFMIEYRLGGIEVKRLEKLREAMKKASFQGAFLHKRENVFYMSGFTGTEGSLYITVDRAVILVDSRYEEQATKECPDFEVKRVMDPTRFEVAVEDETIIGFEADHVTVNLFEQMREYLPQQLTLRNIAPLLNNIRLYKDEDELSRLQRAVDIADEAFQHILPFIKEGVREIDVAIELDFFMRKLGAQGPSFDFIVASGERSSMPHGVASVKRIVSGNAITMDYGCICNRYCSDMTRTVYLGEPGAEQRELYAIVKEGQKRAFEAMAVAVDATVPDKGARDYFAEKGLDGYFGHSLGHGVGLEVHEGPVVSPHGKMKLEPNMVFTNEPGIYLPGKYGVRIEDMIVMTPTGPVTMTASSKELIIL